jgi:transaldolase
LNAKRIWAANQEFWADKNCPLQQEMIFASTGTKKPADPPWKYVAALAGSDIQTNPPGTNQKIAETDMTFSRQVDVLPPAAVVAEIDDKVDFQHLEETLMQEGIAKFANPQIELKNLIQQMRATLVSG